MHKKLEMKESKDAGKSPKKRVKSGVGKQGIRKKLHGFHFKRIKEKEVKLQS